MIVLPKFAPGANVFSRTPRKYVPVKCSKCKHVEHKPIESRISGFFVRVVIVYYHFNIDKPTVTYRLSNGPLCRNTVTREEKCVFATRAEVRKHKCNYDC